MIKTIYKFGNFEQHYKPILLKRQAIVLVDKNVFKFHKNKLSGLRTIIVESGEAYKNQNTINHIYDKLIKMEADRTTFLVGIGGGVITDMAGYVAATYMRGIAVGFVPTTLLAQVDASIGGKNGIDHGVYKNLIGTIRQPQEIFFDAQLLYTMPQNEWINGCAEIIKHACIRDEKLFALLRKNDLKTIQTNEKLLQKIIKINVKIKRLIIEQDPFEQHERKMLNFGHTFGHAIENMYGLSHGQAVALGMVVATKMSALVNGFKKNHFESIQDLIQKYGLPIKYKVDILKVFNVLRMDKKRAKENIYFILLDKIGEARIEKINIEKLKTLLSQIVLE